MEKAFWGMVAGCALAFGILLTMYLNKTGVIDLSPEPATEAVETAGINQKSTMDSDELYALVYGDDWVEREEEMPESETEEKVQEELLYTYEEEVEKSGFVEPDRNDEQEYFMPESSTQSQSSEEEEKEENDTPESKENKEYKYDLNQEISWKKFRCGYS